MNTIEKSWLLLYLIVLLKVWIHIDSNLVLLILFMKVLVKKPEENDLNYYHLTKGCLF